MYSRVGECEPDMEIGCLGFLMQILLDKGHWQAIQFIHACMDQNTTTQLPVEFMYFFIVTSTILILGTSVLGTY